MIDINCDMGESYGNFKVGQDELIMPHISSCNIACGHHSGDPTTILNTVTLAKKHHLKIGAHPGYPDLVGFGRRSMDISLRDFEAGMLYQISALKGIIDFVGDVLHHVKPHGALYHDLDNKEEKALSFCKTVYAISPEIIIYASPHGLLGQVASNSGLTVWKEGFADRRYTPEVKLVSRTEENAVITDPEVALNQVLQMVQDDKVTCVDGVTRQIEVDTICIHGDTKNALAIAQKLSYLRSV